MRNPYAIKRSMQGFTLIEILIVAFIIGMTASLISLSVGDDKTDKPPYREAEALITAVDFVGEYAALNGEVIGMFVIPRQADESTGKQWCYNWKRMRDGSWIDMPEDSLTEHCMGDTVQWEMVVEGQIYNYDPDLEIHPPVLVFSPSGEAIPVEMSIFEEGTASDSEAQHIEIDMMGEIRWIEQEKLDEQ